MKPNFAFLASDPHAFVKPEDVEEASLIEADINDLEQQLQSLTPDGLIKRFQEARNKYIGAASAENLAEAKKALIEMETFRLKTELRSLPRSALNKIYSKRAIPLGKRIVERALGVAKARLDKVRTEERERTLKITGLEMTHSSIVDSALVPVSQLERLLSEAGSPTGWIVYRPRRILNLFVNNTGPNGSGKRSGDSMSPKFRTQKES